ncbi:hypothetical protein QQ045_008108 [Rhodiola kirilowii]
MGKNQRLHLRYTHNVANLLWKIVVGVLLEKDAYEKYEKLLAEAQTPIYVESDKSVLGTILTAMKVKVDNGWSDKSFNNHLKITQELLPSPNNYPSTYREVKRILKNMGMGYEIIHACEYGCVLFYTNLKNLVHCPVCNTTRYLHLDGNNKISSKVTISDFPGLGMLGGLKSKGYKACPLCLDDVDAHHLAGRISYQGHLKWLDRDHSWRHAPREEISSNVLSHEYPILSLHPDFKLKGVKEKLCWTHVSVFYDLPYWSTLRKPYSLDVMHIENNIFDNIIGTILGLQEKTKNDIKAREGLEKQEIQKEFWWKKKGSTSRTQKVSQAP